MKISKKLFIGFMTLTLLVVLVGVISGISYESAERNSDIIVRILELNKVLDESLVELFALTQTVNSNDFTVKKRDYEETRVSYDTLFRSINKENSKDLLSIGFDITLLRKDAADVAKISNTLIALHKRMLSKLNEFEEKKKMERDIRHKVRVPILASNDIEIIRDLGWMQYFSKEAMFQYRDRERFNKWQNQIMKIKNNSLLAASPDILDDLDAYLRISQDIAGIIFERKVVEGKMINAFSKLNDLIEKVKEHDSLIINKLKKESEATSSKIHLIMYIVIAVTFIMSSVLGITISHSITQPILKLKRAARELGQGNMDAEIDIKLNDEIGELAVSFNNMTKEVKETTVSRNELAKEVIERKKAENEIQIQSETMQNTLEAITHPFYVIDANDFKIKLANSATTNDGFKDGMTCFELTHKRDRPCSGKTHICPLGKIKETKKPVRVEHIHQNHDGSQKYVEISAYPIFNQGGDVQQIIEYTVDITDRKKADEKIKRHVNYLNALHSIDSAIAASFDIKITTGILLDHVMTQLGVDAATILRLDPSMAILEFTAGRGLLTGALKYTRLQLGEGNAGRAAVERHMVRIDNLKENKHGFDRSETFREEGFMSYIGVPLIAKGQVKGVMELFHRSTLKKDTEWMDFLVTLSGQAAIMLDNATLFEELQDSNTELFLAYDSTIEGWAQALDMRDKETEGHSRRVTDMTLRVASEIGIKREDQIHLKRGALLHDIGKMGIPDNILLKPGRLTDEERGIMQLHPQKAYDLLKKIKYLRPALKIPYCHHEKWNGTGYPRGLKGEDIPLEARIFAIVDVWDALMSDRPYRPAWKREKVIEHIKSLSGTHFDPDIVHVFLKMVVEKNKALHA